jgi:hypothetical protein
MFPRPSRNKMCFFGVVLQHTYIRFGTRETWAWASLMSHAKDQRTCIAIAGLISQWTITCTTLMYRSVIIVAMKSESSHLIRKRKFPVYSHPICVCVCVERMCCMYLVFSAGD